MYNVHFSHFHSRKCKNIFYVFCLLRQSHSSIQKGTTHNSFFLSCAPFLPSCLSTPLCCMEKSLSCWPKFAFHCWKSYSCLWKRDSRAKASGYICYYFIPLYTSTNQKVVGSNPAGLTKGKALYRNGYRAFSYVPKQPWKRALGTILGTGIRK